MYKPREYLFSKFSVTILYVLRRNLTANEASVVLRPFYAVVHPDRFGRDPKTRSKNEKSLQVYHYIMFCEF